VAFRRPRCAWPAESRRSLRSHLVPRHAVRASEQGTSPDGSVVKPLACRPLHRGAPRHAWEATGKIAGTAESRYILSVSLMESTTRTTSSPRSWSRMANGGSVIVPRSRVRTGKGGRKRSVCRVSRKPLISSLKTAGTMACGACPRGRDPGNGDRGMKRQALLRHLWRHGCRLEPGHKGCVAGLGLCLRRGATAGALPKGVLSEMLEPDDGKLSRTVLRGEEGGDALALPGL